MSEKRVRDIMGCSNLVEVGTETTIKELARTFQRMVNAGNSNPTALVKKGDSIVGMVDIKDLLEILNPPFVKGKIKMEIFWEGLFTDQWKEVEKKKVSQIMRMPLTVSPGDTLMKVSHALNENQMNMALVMEKERFIGTVSAGDLLGELVEEPRDVSRATA